MKFPLMYLFCNFLKFFHEVNPCNVVAEEDDVNYNNECCRREPAMLLKCMARNPCNRRAIEVEKCSN